MCKKLLTAMLMTILMMVFMAASCFATGTTDWEGQKFTAIGSGVAPAKAVNIAQARIMARRAAVVDAYRQLAEAIRGVNVTSDTTVENMMVTSDVVKTKISASIKGARVISEGPTPDGGYTVTMEVPMFGVSGSVSQAVIEPPQEQKAFPEPVPDVIPSLPADTNSTAINQFKVLPKAGDSPMAARGGFTGVIIDCRGLGLKPVMSPVIKNDRGLPIYGHENLNYDLVVRDGMVGYASSMGSTSRAGSNPLVIKAQSLTDHNANPVISTADANRLLIENGASGFLNQTRVVFLR